MPIHFLDVAAARGLNLEILIIFAAIVLVETIVLLLFRFNTFLKCLLNSFLANLASILVGYLMSFLFENINYDEDYTWLLIAFLLSILIEGLTVKALNMQKANIKIWLPVIVMNLVSYLGLIGLYNILK